MRSFGWIRNNWLCNQALEGFVKGFRPGLITRPVEIEFPIMVLFTMSRIGAYYDVKWEI